MGLHDGDSAPPKSINVYSPSNPIRFIDIIFRILVKGICTTFWRNCGIRTESEPKMFSKF